MTTPRGDKWKSQSPERLLCDWHRKGIPVFAIGIKFFLQGCPTCEAKCSRGQVGVDDPSPRQIWLAREKSNKRDKHAKRLKAFGFKYGKKVAPVNALSASAPTPQDGYFATPPSEVLAEATATLLPNTTPLSLR